MSLSQPENFQQIETCIYINLPVSMPIILRFLPVSMPIIVDYQSPFTVRRNPIYMRTLPPLN